MSNVSYWLMPSIKRATTNNTINEVCKHFGINKKQLRGKCRLRNYVEARSIIGYVLSNHTTMILTEIGYKLNRHHASVIHYNKKVSGFMDVDKSYKELVNSFI